MSWKGALNNFMNDPVGQWIGRVLSSIPVTYTIFYDNIDGIYRAEYSGRNGDDFSGTDFVTVLQTAINALGVNGGAIFLRKGTYDCTNTIVPAPFPNDGNGSLIIRGEGMYNTILKVDSDFNTWGGFNGLIGIGLSGVAPKLHQLFMADLTLDGNYDGVGGTVPQPVAAQPALVSICQPFDRATLPTAPAGVYHQFHQVRFYRPSAYTFQPAQNCHLTSCLFDECGQYDKGWVTGAELHYDILGGGDWCNARVFNSQFEHCAGNYVDFVAGTSGKPCHLIFQGNTSSWHLIGGIYALGHWSMITGNRLQNLFAACGVYSGIGYDAGTHVNNRYGNIVAHNTLQYLLVDTGLIYYDLVVNNTGYVTENSGLTAAIASGTAVNHGLSLTPTNVQVTAAETGPTDIYLTDVGAANFKINFGGGGNKTFYWKAEAKV